MFKYIISWGIILFLMPYLGKIAYGLGIIYSLIESLFDILTWFWVSCKVVSNLSSMLAIFFIFLIFFKFYKKFLE